LTNTLILNRPRRWCLALGAPVALALVAYGGLIYVGLVGQDSFRVDTSVTPIGGKISVGIGSGDISVGPSRDGQAHLNGVVSYSIVRPSVHWHSTAAGTFLDGPNCNWLGNCGAVLTVTLPAEQAVNASSGSGNVHAFGVGGGLTLYSGSGDVSVERASGPLDLGAGSGDITATGLSGAKVGANVGSGDVDLSFNRPPSRVTVTASSGDITVALPSNVSYAVDASTSSGSSHIGVPTSSSSPRVIHLTAGSGNVDVIPSQP
jgi:hypothetical protein